MKFFTVKLRNVFCSIPKLNHQIQKICGLRYSDALNIISSTQKRISLILIKLLRSAYFNISNQLNGDVNNIFVNEIFFTPGHKIKKIFPRAKGKTDIRQKHFSNVTLILLKL